MTTPETALLENKNVLKFKQQVYDHYKDVLNDKVSLLQKKLQDLVDTTKNETKSSAGDKYETGRAMLQIEQDNVRKQLKDALEQKTLFEKIGIKVSSTQIVKGSLVKTDKGYFFLSVALGRINVNNIEVIALSPQSPLGSKLIGLKTTKCATFNGNKYIIESIQ